DDGMVGAMRLGEVTGRARRKAGGAHVVGHVVGAILAVVRERVVGKHAAHRGWSTLTAHARLAHRTGAAGGAAVERVAGDAVAPGPLLPGWARRARAAGDLLGGDAERSVQATVERQHGGHVAALTVGTARGHRIARGALQVPGPQDFVFAADAVDVTARAAKRLTGEAR